MGKKETFFDYPDFNNIKEIMYNSFKNYPKNIAFRIKEKIDDNIKYIDITYEEFSNEVNKFGTGLYSIGMKNKRIAILSKNRYEWILSYISILLGGMVAVPLDKELTEIEIENSLIRSKAECIIYDEKYGEIIKRINDKKTTKLNTIICMQKNEEVKSISDIQKIGESELKKGNMEYTSAKINEHDLAEIVFTSGTTSNSKAVMLSQYNVAKNTCDLRKVEPCQSDDVSIALLPFHHKYASTGMIFAMSGGMMTVFPDGLKYIAKNLKEYHVTFFMGVPKISEMMYYKLVDELKKKKIYRLIKIAQVFTNLLLKLKIDVRRKVYKKIIDELGGLRYVINGAAALNPKVEKGFDDLGISILQGYGLTECAPTLISENYGNRKYGTIGVPMPSVKVEIVNKDENGIGELRAKGPNIMMGYLDDEETTKKVLRDGWFYTGDLAYMDKNGYIVLAGRSKDMIVLKNGKKVFPEEIESLINSIDLVEESFVYAMPKNDDVMLSVKIKYDQNKVKENYPHGLRKEELEKIIWEKVKGINKMIPKYKYVKHMILTTEDFIKTSTNKIKRFEEMKRCMQN